MRFNALRALQTLFRILLVMSATEGILFHSSEHQCMPAALFTWVPRSFSVGSSITCALACKKMSCLALVYDEETGTCKIYGEWYSPKTNILTYVDTSVAAPPPGGPLREVAQGKPATARKEATSPALAVDDDLTTYFEGSFVVYMSWMVDLEAFYFIHNVDVQPRSDGDSASMFHDIEIKIESLGSQETLGLPYTQTYTADLGRIQFSDLQGLCGRLVVVQRTTKTKDLLSLVDVDVYAR